jgi:uncharacterized membrane protein
MHAVASTMYSYLHTMLLSLYVHMAGKRKAEHTLLLVIHDIYLQLHGHFRDRVFLHALQYHLLC